MSEPITIQAIIQNFKGYPHQVAAVVAMEADLKANGYAIAMNRERDWFRTWSTPPPKPQLQQDSVLLKVPYFSQMDNENDQDGPGWRQCASSSCAMLAAFWGKLSGGDEAYKDCRQRYGDTTDPMAHVAALRALGLIVEFRTNGTAAILRAELAAGRPVATGWLHHGPVTAPKGGGHWTVAIGYSKTDIIHHDPYGEANLIGGGYITTAVGAGRSVRYSISNWLPRWALNGTDGWMITARAV